MTKERAGARTSILAARPLCFEGLLECSSLLRALFGGVRALDNVVVSAHVASVSERAVRELRRSAAGTVAAAVRGEPLPNVVNGAALRIDGGTVAASVEGT